MPIIEVISTATHAADVVHRIATFNWTKKTVIQFGIAVSALVVASAVLYKLSASDVARNKGGDENEENPE